MAAPRGWRFLDRQPFVFIHHETKAVA